MAVVKLKTGSGEEITIDDSNKLGKGGEGTVYAVLTPKYSHYCVKEYSTAILDDSAKLAERQAKVEYMSKNQVISPNPSIVICWPADAIYRNGRFIGFMMLKAFDQSKELEWFVTYNLRKIIKNTEFSTFDGSNGIRSIYNRLVVANNLAHALHFIHCTNQYVLADTKPKNILITSTGNVSVVDLDSVQIVVDDQLKFKAPVASPNYKPPEGYDGRLNQECDIIPISWDRFSYAVMAYELIIGSHPYGVGSYKAPYDQGDDTMYKIRTGLFLHGNKSPYLRTENEGSLATIRERWDVLPEPLRQLFMSAFEKGQFKPEKRPTMQEWGQTLSTSITGLKSSLLQNSNAASTIRSASAAIKLGGLPAREKHVPMSTPTHTTIPRPNGPISHASYANIASSQPPTYNTSPPKAGLTSSDKFVLCCVAFIGLIIWAIIGSSSGNVQNNSTTIPSSMQTDPYPQVAVPTETASIDEDPATIDASAATAIAPAATPDIQQDASDVVAAPDITFNTTFLTSFDCTKAKSLPENLICHDAELAAADRGLTGIFNQAKTAATDKAEFTKRARKQWNYREKNCLDKACVATWYDSMKDILNQIAQTGNANIDVSPVTATHPAVSTDATPFQPTVAMYLYDAGGWRFNSTTQKWVNARNDGRTDIAVTYSSGRVIPAD